MNTKPIDHKIEFMAWDEDNKRLFTFEELSSLDKDGAEYLIDVLLYKNKMYPMQLTDLRSINNEPIYNHQIVKSEHSNYYCVDMFNYSLMWTLSLSKLEIVGNRFQHPELLELCK